MERHRLREKIRLNLKNIPGWSTTRKLVIIECDDWGGIRMPSGEAFNQLMSAGIPLKQDRFTKYDTMESAEDQETMSNSN